MNDYTTVKAVRDLRDEVIGNPRELEIEIKGKHQAAAARELRRNPRRFHNPKEGRLLPASPDRCDGFTRRRA